MSRLGRAERSGLWLRAVRDAVWSARSIRVRGTAAARWQQDEVSAAGGEHLKCESVARAKQNLFSACPYSQVARPARAEL